MTSAGIEPATFQFVAQHVNHCATAVPTLPPYYFQFKTRFLVHFSELKIKARLKFEVLFFTPQKP